MVNRSIVNLREAARQLLENNILLFWQTRMVDNERGGFYGRIDGQNILHPDAPKGAVLNARILWTFASAARVLHNTPYRILAARAYDYLMQRFIDREHGGVFWSLNADGTPLDTKKQTYAIAFAIYGLAEYVRLTDNREALETAISLFNDIEAHAFDAGHTGYIEALTRDWQSITDMRLSDKDENSVFTMNTHLHVLEAYTNLYRVWPDERLRQCLINIITVFTERLYNPETGHVDCFFDAQWNGRHDIASYGHDIEAAWLLNEAFNVLIPQEQKVQSYETRITHNIALASLEGLQPDGSMIHEAKTSNHPSPSTNTGSAREWWVECEAVVGFIDQWQITGQQEWWTRAEAVWHYIENHLLDREHGEWFWSVLPDGTPDTGNDKAGFWKCPYHNSRMCLELIERL